MDYYLPSVGPNLQVTEPTLLWFLFLFLFPKNKAISHRQAFVIFKYDVLSCRLINPLTFPVKRWAETHGNRPARLVVSVTLTERFCHCIKPTHTGLLHVVFTQSCWKLPKINLLNVIYPQQSLRKPCLAWGGRLRPPALSQAVEI